MQNEITIVSFHETYTGDAGSHTINTFGERYEAKAFILNNLEATDECHKEILRKDVSKKLQDSLMYGKKGRYDYTDGDHEYSIAWDFVPASSNVSDEELISVIEQYCNANMSQAEYDAVAKQATQTMHRYCQNEMYRLVASLIRAMATCRYDERNARMHNRAEMIAKFMDEYNL